MGERRFLVLEANEEIANRWHTITESELKRRYVYGLVKTHLAPGKIIDNEVWNKVRNILIHGEGEKGDECTNHDEELGTREWTPKQLAKHLREHPECEVCLCKPSPTRAEWEAIQYIAASTMTPENKTWCVLKILQGS